MADRKIPGKRIGVIKDIYGYYSTPVQRLINCDNVQLISTDQITTRGITLMSGALLNPGTIYKPDMLVSNMPANALVSAVKLHTDKGPVWISVSDHTALIAACNACCIP